MDRWEQNPEILMMRQVFRQMEAGQDGLLAKLKISLLDSRLPRWRQEDVVAQLELYLQLQRQQPRVIGEEERNAPREEPAQPVPGQAA